MGNELYVAETIVQQIKTGDPVALMCWGAHNYAGSDRETDLIELDDDGKSKVVWKDFGCRGYVQFDVQGYKFTGRVMVGLNVMDVYDVVFFNIDAANGICHMVDKINDVYCDELANTIDKYVERD